MSHRSVVISSFEEYLSDEFASVEDPAAETADRNIHLSRFPYNVMLQVAYPELDYANRWCWENFGPGDGQCLQRDSEYRVCERPDPHSHVGKWTSHWWAKIDYDFGFNEWYFAESDDRELFVANIENINWGEHYPK
jgi:hypothetical protein